MKAWITAASAAALLVAVPALAANSNNSSLNGQDQQFVKETSAGNMAEQELGKMAERKGATAAVREYGRWLATDHAFANKRLQTIAERDNAWQSPQLTQEQKDLKQRLQSAQGRQFNTEFVSAMVTDHQKTIQKFQAEESQGQNDGLKTYAKNLLPVLQQHLAEAQELESGNRVVYGSAREGASGSSTRPMPPPKTH